MQPSIKLLSCWLPKKPSLKWSRTQTKKKSGRKPLPQEVIDLIIEMKKRNPLVGYGRISSLCLFPLHIGSAASGQNA